MFEKGDIITCIDAEQSQNCLTKFKEYLVLSTTSRNGIIEGVYVVDDTNTEERYFATRFVLVSSRENLIKKMFEKFK